MAAVTVEFHRLALKEYDEACHWYGERSSRATQNFEIAVDEAVARIANSSESLPKISGNYRWASVRHYPYTLVFRHRRPDHVVIVAVSHTSRRPGYWRRRT